MSATERQEIRAKLAAHKAARKIEAAERDAHDAGLTAGAAGHERRCPHRNPAWKAHWLRGWDTGRAILEQRRARRETPPAEQQRLLDRWADIKRALVGAMDVERGE